MNNDGLQRLKEIGAQKIYEDTHIAVEHIQEILHESFDGLSKIHFVGFISILQREYDLDLSELKEKGLIYYNERTPVEETTEDGIFIAPKKSRNFALLYILLAMVIFLIALYYSVEYTNKGVQEHAQKIDNTTINNAKNNINYAVVETNVSIKEENKTTVDENISKLDEKAAPFVEKTQGSIKNFKVIARSKVWMGYIDIGTNKKYQKTFEGEFDIDPTKEWLLIFGHGYIDIIIDTKKTEFKSKKTLRLLYKNGMIQEITLDEFKKLNRGNVW